MNAFKKGLLTLGTLALMCSGMRSPGYAADKAQVKQEYLRPECKPALDDLVSAQDDWKTYQQHWNQNRLKSAIEKWERALKIVPKCGVAWNDLGVAYHNDARLQDAVDAYKEAIKLNPMVPIIYRNLAFAYRKIGEKTNDRQYFYLAISMDKECIKLSQSLDPDLAQKSKNAISFIRTKYLKE